MASPFYDRKVVPIRRTNVIAKLSLSDIVKAIVSSLVGMSVPVFFTVFSQVWFSQGVVEYSRSITQSGALYSVTARNDNSATMRVILASSSRIKNVVGGEGLAFVTVEHPENSRSALITIDKLPSRSTYTTTFEVEKSGDESLYLIEPSTGVKLVKAGLSGAINWSQIVTQFGMTVVLLWCLLLLFEMRLRVITDKVVSLRSELDQQRIGIDSKGEELRKLNAVIVRTRHYYGRVTTILQARIVFWEQNFSRAFLAGGVQQSVTKQLMAHIYKANNLEPLPDRDPDRGITLDLEILIDDLKRKAIEDSLK